MKNLYASLIGIVTLLVVVPLALAKPPSWDDQINNPSRFQELEEFGDAAVLDKEAGLVWDESPSTDTLTWFDAQARCINLLVGAGVSSARGGWRLPTVQELKSLVDPAGIGGPGPVLPPGHPFDNVQSDDYWTATTSALFTDRAWTVTFFNGVAIFAPKTSMANFWCVRGGQGVDPQ